MSQVILTEKMMTAVWRRATLNGHPAAVANAKDNLNSFYCYVGALSSSGLDPRLRILDQLFDSLIKVALAARKAYFGAKYRVREPKLDDQNPVCISMRHLAKVQRLSDTQGTGVGTREGSEEEESEESGSAQKSSLEALAFVAAISLKLELQMNGAGPSSLPPTPYPTTPRYMVHANRFSKTEPQGTSPASSSAETPWSQKSWNSGSSCITIRSTCAHFWPDHVSPLRLPVRDDDEDVFM
ncbi:hypothetical protein FB45DRAFT_378684 [Roridomyces roridus]|uniref:Uncharacterized protein n=1 Tax=Roridomyces roridus TaxID=1738132 RepID=A0AAD7B2B0_9AGAR|nr:hypothetical protein FB45DRAFT_378684 [Roridomyces roridus]